MAKIIYTLTDEAPMLATYSFLPVIEAFASTAGVEVETRDISSPGGSSPRSTTSSQDQRVGDALAELGQLATTPEANIIKLPNISASVPQLKAAIAELKAKGYDLPDYPDEPRTDEEKDARARYDSVKGSAVNPVLREGNSTAAPGAVKNYAPQHLHSMGAWSADSRTNVATMGRDDFRSNEQSVVMPGADTLTIQLVGESGTTVLKDGLKVLEGEVVAPPSCGPPPSTPSWRADRPRQGRGRPVLGAPQGDHDEGLGPDHLRPRRPGLPARGVRGLRRASSRPRA